MTTSQLCRAGLDALTELAPTPASQCLLDGLALNARGSTLWRKRKLMEARELLVLAELAPPGRMMMIVPAKPPATSSGGRALRHSARSHPLSYTRDLPYVQGCSDL